MARKPLELPPEVGRSFMADLKAFYAEDNPIKRDEIAARQRREEKRRGKFAVVWLLRLENDALEFSPMAASILWRCRANPGAAPGNQRTTVAQIRRADPVAANHASVMMGPDA
jgi:hypothetical protein